MSEFEEGRSLSPESLLKSEYRNEIGDLYAHIMDTQHHTLDDFLQLCSQLYNQRRDSERNQYLVRPFDILFPQFAGIEFRQSSYEEFHKRLSIMVEEINKTYKQLLATQGTKLREPLINTLRASIRELYEAYKEFSSNEGVKTRVPDADKVIVEEPPQQPASQPEKKLEGQSEHPERILERYYYNNFGRYHGSARSRSPETFWHICETQYEEHGVLIRNMGDTEEFKGFDFIDPPSIAFKNILEKIAFQINELYKEVMNQITPKEAIRPKLANLLDKADQVHTNYQAEMRKIRFNK